MIWLVLGVAALVHAPGLLGQYALDDHHAILHHPAVNGELSWWEVWSREWFGRPLLEGWSSSYRPLTSTSFALERRLSEAPWLSHLVNWLGYLGVCALLMRALLARVSSTAALWAGLLFALWPVHVEDVASLVGRAELLASALALLALLRVDADEVSARDCVAAGLLYAAALLSKESVALLPGIVGWRVLVRHRAGTASRRHWIGVGVLAAVGVAYIIPRQLLLSVDLPEQFVGADNPLMTYAGAERVWGTFSVLGHYADVSLRALRLCADHTWADVIPARSAFGADAGFVWIGLLLFAGAALDAWRAWQGRSPGWWAAAALAYLLVGHFLIPLSVVLAERLLLWPSVLLALGLGHLLDGRSADMRRPLRVALALLALWWGGRSFVRSFDWHDDITLGRASVQACPRAVHNRLNLAAVLADAGEHDEAIWHFALAATARRSFPAFEPLPAYEVEFELPLNERLAQLPQLVGAPSGSAFWMAMANYLAQEGWTATAQQAARRAGGAP